MSKSVSKNEAATKRHPARKVMADAAMRNADWLTLSVALRDLRGYRNDLEARLAPLWKAAQAELPRPLPAHFEDLKARRELRVVTPVTRYVRELEAFVLKTLRMTEDGRPSPQACDMVHAHVKGWDFPIMGFTTVGAVHRFTVEVDLTGHRATMTLRDEAGDVVPGPSQDRSSAAASSLSGLRSTREPASVELWAASHERLSDLKPFEAEVVECIVQQIRLRAQALNDEYGPGNGRTTQYRNTKNLEDRYRADIPALAELLYRGRHPDRFTEKRLRHIVAKLGLDWPRTSRRSSAA